jgi:glycosyltransferase involved in cell wall biosynthesis
MPLADQRGGAEVALEQLVRHSPAEDRWRVVFLDRGPMAVAFERAGHAQSVVEAGRLRQGRRYLLSIARLARLLRAERPDVVLAWMTKAQLYGGPAATIAGVPSVWVQHGMPSPNGLLDRAATAWPTDGVIAVSHAVGLAQGALRPRRPVRVVHPGVDTERFDPTRLPSVAESRSRLGLPIDGPLVGIFARLQRWKGIHLLISAMRELLPAHPTLKCVVVGGVHELEPDYEAELFAQVARLGLGEQIIFAGRQVDVPLWMQAMDIIVNASAIEPFGLTVVEAMALGKPVVASASAGPSEIVRTGVDGLLVPPNDEAAIGRALSELLENPALAESLGLSGRERALAKFSSFRFAERFGEAVRELLR